LTGSSNGKTIKWVNVSGNGSNGQVWIYCNFAVQLIWGLKKVSTTRMIDDEPKVKRNIFKRTKK
jgi:hypothetical protein